MSLSSTDWGEMLLIWIVIINKGVAYKALSGQTAVFTAHQREQEVYIIFNCSCWGLVLRGNVQPNGVRTASGQQPSHLPTATMCNATEVCRDHHSHSSALDLTEVNILNIRLICNSVRTGYNVWFHVNHSRRSQFLQYDSVFTFDTLQWHWSSDGVTLSKSVNVWMSTFFDNPNTPIHRPASCHEMTHSFQGLKMHT